MLSLKELAYLKEPVYQETNKIRSALYIGLYDTINLSQFSRVCEQE